MHVSDNRCGPASSRYGGHRILPRLLVFTFMIIIIFYQFNCARPRLKRKDTRALYTYNIYINDINYNTRPCKLGEIYIRRATILDCNIIHYIL